MLACIQVSMQAENKVGPVARARLEDSRPLYETVYEAVRQRIIDGSLRSGETISEVQLAEGLSVSRTPVREAVRRLITEQLLVPSEKGSLRVYAPTAADLAEVYCTRATLEGMAGRLAAMHSDNQFVGLLESICTKHAGLPGADSTHEAALLNGEFHQAIVDRAGNQRINSLLAALNPVVVRYRHISLAYREHLTQSWQEHSHIVELFKDSSPDALEAHLRSHILKAGGRIVAAMRAFEGPSQELTAAMELVLSA